MSTLIERWGEALLSMLQWSKDRPYTIRGQVVFHAYGIEDIDFLRVAILEVDAQQPWVDDHLHPDANADSIFYIHGDPIPQNGMPNSAPRYWFSIYPGTRNLRRQQVYAYQRYLEALGASLAKKGLPGVTGVHVVLEVLSASKTFKKETPQTIDDVSSTTLPTNPPTDRFV
ncbi:hypothetical protein HQ487_03910 [Candidatus Uhrbacteria bacterium]|nr:hypothetical protein [Candidatus Uhrbacteria bacterium]